MLIVYAAVTFILCKGLELILRNEILTKKSFHSAIRYPKKGSANNKCKQVAPKVGANVNIKKIKTQSNTKDSIFTINFDYY